MERTIALAIVENLIEDGDEISDFDFLDNGDIYVVFVDKEYVERVSYYTQEELLNYFEV